MNALLEQTQQRINKLAAMTASIPAPQYQGYETSVPAHQVIVSDVPTAVQSEESDGEDSDVTLEHPEVHYQRPIEGDRPGPVSTANPRGKKRPHHAIAGSLTDWSSKDPTRNFRKALTKSLKHTLPTKKQTTQLEFTDPAILAPETKTAPNSGDPLVRDTNSQGCSLIRSLAHAYATLGFSPPYHLYSNEEIAEHYLKVCKGSPPGDEALTVFHHALSCIADSRKSLFLLSKKPRNPTPSLNISGDLNGQLDEFLKIERGVLRDAGLSTPSGLTIPASSQKKHGDSNMSEESFPMRKTKYGLMNEALAALETAEHLPLSELETKDMLMKCQQDPKKLLDKVVVSLDAARGGNLGISDSQFGDAQETWDRLSDMNTFHESPFVRRSSVAQPGVNPNDYHAPDLYDHEFFKHLQDRLDMLVFSWDHPSLTDAKFNELLEKGVGIAYREYYGYGKVLHPSDLARLANLYRRHGSRDETVTPAAAANAATPPELQESARIMQEAIDRLRPINGYKLAYGGVELHDADSEWNEMDDGEFTPATTDSTSPGSGTGFVF